LKREERELKTPEQAVLIAYDGSQPARQALEHAPQLVGANSEVAVVNVIPRESLSARVETVSIRERERQRKLLEEARKLLSNHGVKAHVIAAVGDPVTEILTAAGELDAGTIVVGRRAGIAPHLIHGSLSSKLVRRFAHDVLVVH
jgi:nucleotide-binding universal stress UspA family protein